MEGLAGGGDLTSRAKPGLVKAGSNPCPSGGWDIGEANKMELFAAPGVII
jgi:hypothetical protein